MARGVPGYWNPSRCASCKHEEPSGRVRPSPSERPNGLAQKTVAPNRQRVLGEFCEASDEALTEVVSRLVRGDKEVEDLVVKPIAATRDRVRMLRKGCERAVLLRITSFTTRSESAVSPHPNSLTAELRPEGSTLASGMKTILPLKSRDSSSCGGKSCSPTLSGIRRTEEREIIGSWSWVLSPGSRVQSS